VFCRSNPYNQPKEGSYLFFRNFWDKTLAGYLGNNRCLADQYVWEKKTGAGVIRAVDAGLQGNQVHVNWE